MGDSEDCAALLLRSEFFGGMLGAFPAEELASVAQAFRVAHYHAGQYIFSRGDQSDFLLLIADGRLRVSVMTDDGRELSMRHAISGDVVGEIAALDGRPRSASAFAITDTKAFTLQGADFRGLIKRYPDVSMAIIKILCDRLRDTTDQLESIALYPIEVRLARFLLIALGGRTAEAGKRVPLELGFSQSELAQLLGASRPKVNVALRQLEDVGAVRRTADRLFCDPAALTRAALLAGDED